MKIILHRTLKFRATRSHSILPSTSQGLLHTTNDSVFRASCLMTEEKPISDISPVQRNYIDTPNQNYEMTSKKIEACFYEDQETKHSSQRVIYVSLFQLKQAHPLFQILSNAMARLLLSSGLIQKQNSEEPLYIQGQESQEVYLILTGEAKIMNEGRTLGRVKAGGCVGEECVINEIIGKAAAKRVADTCYIDNKGGKSFLLAISQKGLARFREQGFLMGGRKDLQLLEKMLLHNLRQKKSWRKKRSQEEQ